MVVTIPILLTLLVLLALSASFSASEAAMLSINKVRLRHLVEQGHRPAKLSFELLTKLDHVIGTLLVANNLVNVTIVAIVSWISVSAFGPKNGVIVATALSTAVLLVVGEITPKLFAAMHAEFVAFAMARPLKAMMAFLHPITACFTWLSRGLLYLLRSPSKRLSPLITEEELKVMIQMGREEGVLDDHELRMLQRIFGFSDALVAQVMVPRDQISGIDINAHPEEALDVLIEEGHSRVPVYQGSLDDVVGVIYARDLLVNVRHGGLFVLSDLIRPIVIVEHTKRVAELLSEFQRHKTQIAIVKDPSGKTVGLVTIEDLLEEIVGEIHEELPRG